MEIRTPSYYNAFHCIASACPDSCCQGWEVELDRDTAQRYLALEGELGGEMRKIIHKENGHFSFINTQGHCPMWRADGLCRLQAQLGEEVLSHVCREFPRMVQDYGSFQELGLELSCPEAARLILSDKHWHWTASQVPGGEAGDYDPEAMEILRRTRPRILEILADETFSVPQALAAALLYAYQVQGELDGAESSAFDPQSALDSARRWVRPGDRQAILDFYAGLEILSPHWLRRLHQTQEGPWAPQLRQLAQYGVWRYYFQAVSDYDLAARMKAVVLHCLVTHLLGGDPIATAAAYSKEIENDPENLDAILDGGYSHPALTDSALLGLLLE